MDSVAGVVDWAWANHAGEWAWYSRWALVLAFCYAAYKRSALGAIAAAIMLPASLVLIPAPFEPRPAVAALLESQRETFVTAGAGKLMAGLAGLVAYFWVLALAFWRRWILLGVFLINLGAFLRMLICFSLWPENSVTLIPTTLTTVFVVDTAILSVLLYARRRRRGADSAA